MKAAIPLITTATATLLLLACTPTIQKEYVTVPLERPARPVLPKIPSEELQCLSPSTYQKLFERYSLVKDYAIKLETIIDSTKPDNTPDSKHLGEPENVGQ